MARFARIDADSIVQQVIVVSDGVLLNSDGQADEQLGIAFCRQLYGDATNWVQTHKDRSARKNFASVGYTYSDEHDAFIAPKPFPSWSLVVETCVWEAPVAYPSDTTVPYIWDEENLEWVAM